MEPVPLQPKEEGVNAFPIILGSVFIILFLSFVFVSGAWYAESHAFIPSPITVTK